MFEEIIKSASGTAGEALETNAFNKMLKRYRDPLVVKSIVETDAESGAKDVLREAGLRPTLKILETER